jgi:fused signal recognition particle receptor
MVFWRKSKNAAAAEAEEREQRLMRRETDPALGPSTDYEADLDASARRALDPTEGAVLEGLSDTPDEEIPVARVPAAQRERGADEGGWFSRLAAGLSKSSSRLGQGIVDLVTKQKLDAAALGALEDTLIQADLGPEASAQIVAGFAKTRFGKDITDHAVREALAAQIGAILAPAARELEVARPPGGGPFVILMCGVNGAGKTTTVGKLAWRYAFREKRRVVIAAGDTFRAAAVEQLAAWAERAHCPMVQGELGADAAAVAYQAYEKARAEGADVLLVDTAGRLHNKANLMAELGKIVRVLGKAGAGAPHATLLVLDGTSGQNAHAQVEMFTEVAPLTGLVVTKIDGAAKGGVVVALAQRFGLPVPFVGVGERDKDLQRLRPHDYARALVGLPAA